MLGALCIEGIFCCVRYEVSERVHLPGCFHPYYKAQSVYVSLCVFVCYVPVDPSRPFMAPVLVLSCLKLSLCLLLYYHTVNSCFRHVQLFTICFCMQVIYCQFWLVNML